MQTFANISQLAFTMLLLPVSNAVVEQAFSQVTIIKTKARNRLNVRMLASLMIIRTHLLWRGKCCRNFEPTEDMIKHFNSTMYDDDSQKSAGASEDVNDIL
jgi:hypothetical protein